MPELNIAIDAMGGDNGPSIVIEALEQLFHECVSHHFFVVGQSDSLTPLLKQQHGLHEHSAVSFVHAEQVVHMDDKPGQSLRDQSRIRLCVLRWNCSIKARPMRSSAVVIPARLMTNAYFQLKTLPGVLRPALMTAIPNQVGGKSFLLDLGANASCDSDTLFQFGVMGSVAADTLENDRDRKSALLNMGEEDIKGNDVVRNAAAAADRVRRIEL